MSDFRRIAHHVRDYLELVNEQRDCLRALLVQAQRCAQLGAAAQKLAAKIERLQETHDIGVSSFSDAVDELEVRHRAGDDVYEALVEGPLGRINVQLLVRMVQKEINR